MWLEVIEMSSPLVEEIGKLVNRLLQYEHLGSMDSSVYVFCTVGKNDTKSNKTAENEVIVCMLGS